LAQEPVFLTREQIEEIHRDQIDSFGGIHGLRDEGAIESAIAQPLNVYFYGNGDLYEIAGAYAYHFAESQAYLDGNKRTGVQAALDFLEVNGIDTSSLPEIAAYEAMIAAANHALDGAGLAKFLRETWCGVNARRGRDRRALQEPVRRLGIVNS
jgi:death-on-curing protein